MNINIDRLKSLRNKLDKEYIDLEKEINKLYSQKKDDVALEKIKAQDLIDQQLDLIDTIIFNLENTPKLYNDLMDLNQKYKRIVGD